MEISDESVLLFPSYTLIKEDSEPDFTLDFLHDDLAISWNACQPVLSGIGKPFIHYFMHKLFIDSDTFCLADIPHLKPEDLQWQIVVQYEFFDK